MFEQILPRHIDNVYRGQALSLWIFGLVLLLKTGIALGSIFNGRGAAQNADGIPLDTFGAGGANALLTLFAIWGLAQLVFSALGVLALARYRAMIPLLYLLFFLEHLTRRLILLAKPIARNGTPSGFYINLALIGLLGLGLALSLWRRGEIPLQQ